MVRDFVVTAHVAEYFEVTYRNFDCDIERTEKFTLEYDAHEFVNSRRLYVMSFVKITDMMTNVERARYER